MIIVLEKTCDFDLAAGPQVGLVTLSHGGSRRSLKQPGGAMRRLEMPDTRVFVDLGVREPLSDA